MGLSIKVTHVQPLDDLWLRVNFVNGETKYYDIKQLIKTFPVYEDLYNRDIYQLVKVDCGGYAVSWNSDIDISECELWGNGVSSEQYTQIVSGASALA